MFVSQQAKRCIFYDASFRLRWRIFVFREEYKMKKLILSALSLTFILSAAFFASGCGKKDNHTHSFTQEIAEDKYLASEATCTEKARYYYSCNCGKAGKETFGYGSPLGHKLNNDNVCSFCGKSASEGLFFSLQGNEYTLIDIGTCEDTDIIIPKTYNGCPVSAIGDRAFSDCSLLTKVTIPDSITSIGNAAFYRCGKLASIILPNSLKSIGEQAFEQCSSLIDITIPDGITSIGDNAFSLCSELTSVIWNAKNCTNISYDIYRPIFSNCLNLTNITIGDNVKAVSYRMFNGCSGLINISVGGGNRHFTSIDGNLFNKDSTRLLQYAKGKADVSYTIPDCVTTIGDYAFSGCDLRRIIIPNGITSIGDYAFSNCGTLKIIVWKAENCTNVNSPIFTNCSSLTEVTIADGVKVIPPYAFCGCSNLTSIIIPNSVITIGTSAFNGCENLQYNKYGNAFYLGNADNPYVALIKANSENITSCTIHEGTKTIACFAFRGCYSLTNITIPDGVTSIGNCAFENCGTLTSISIPDGVTSIGDSVFENCSSLTSITIPDSVTSIGNSAFKHCGKLASIAIPDGVTSIGDYAFNGCSSLTSIAIPDSVTSIGDWAFSDCGRLTSISIPDSVTSIGDSAFALCSKLTSITVDNDNKYFSSINGNLYNKDKTKLLQYAIGKIDTSFTIPNGVTSIGDFAFSACFSLTKVIISDNVTSIGDSAFEFCGELTSISIPDSITSIGDKAFNGCDNLQYNEYDNAFYLGNDTNQYAVIMKSKSMRITSCNINDNCKVIYYESFLSCRLTNIIIPDSVTSIGSEAFSNCDSLTSITIGNSVTSIGDSAFEFCGELTSITIGNCVTSIGYSAFRDCSGLTSITIPDSVTSIGSFAFSGCSGLTNITIPNSITSIDMWVFNGCNKLKTVFFKGTAEEWVKILIKGSSNNLRNATRYFYSENKPTDDGNYWHYDTDGVTPVIW